MKPEAAYDPLLPPGSGACQYARGQWTSDKLFAWADEQDAPARKEG